MCLRLFAYEHFPCNIIHMKQVSIIFYFLLCIVHGIHAQNGLQTIRGKVIDKQSEIPLIGVTIEVLKNDSPIMVTSDLNGNFVIPSIEVGRYELRFRYLGYNSITVPNILTTSGKEVILEIAMEESVISLDEIVISSEVEKDKATNEMATISSRTFSLEEVTRYSGGANDVSRMVSNYAGVSGLDDNRNDIVIRGNSPTGVLWRLEGIPIPNPNHFSTFGTTGGPISALNTNLLKNSDFITSAFPAEYGNANAGVFDIGFRNGNKEKFEFTTQIAAFSGVELMVEGPLNKKAKSSFIIAYRNSLVALLQGTRLNIGTSAIPDYRDLTIKLDFNKTKYGKFSFFGIGGLSNITFLASESEDGDIFGNFGDQDSYVTSTLGIAGMNHRYLIDNKSYIRTTIASSISKNTFLREEFIDTSNKFTNAELDDRNIRYSFSTYWNKKFNARHTARIGFLGEFYNLNSLFQTRGSLLDEWSVNRNFKGRMNMYQLYAQSQYKFSKKWTFNTGIHFQYLDFNSSHSIEPRLAINYHLTEKSTINLGYGLHNQMQPLPIYLYESTNPDGTTSRTNENLDFSRSNHLVLGYDYKFGVDWRLKTELYLQLLDQIGVESFESYFSLINAGADFGFPNRSDLVSNGSGKNYGLELTIEKFFSNDYYALFTASLYDSKYKASDDTIRNTSFNNNWIINVLAGKEWHLNKNKRHTITADFRLTNAGGRFYIPIDLEASNFFGEKVDDIDNAYKKRYPNYFRLDVKVGFRINSSKRKLSHTFYLDFRNITSHKNIFMYRYYEGDKEVRPVYQIGFFPDLLYRVQF